MKRNIILILTFAVCSGFGCASMTKPDLSMIKPSGPPAKSVAVWEPAVKHEAGLEPKRGFGGRVYFYDQESKKPIKIKGNVVVYAFDEDGRKADDNMPTRSYLFDKSDVKKLYSKSKLGPSYNFWIPWDSEGPDGHAKKISLIVRYVPEVGSSVVSSQAVVYLPGKFGQTEIMAKADWDTQNTYEGTIQQVAHWQETSNAKQHAKPEECLLESNDNRPLTMKTSTIR